MGKWLPGQSGNPAGRPKGARHKLSEAVIKEIADDWAIHGLEVVQHVRETKPDVYLQVISRLMPTRDEATTAGVLGGARIPWWRATPPTAPTAMRTAASNVTQRPLPAVASTGTGRMPSRGEIRVAVQAGNRTAANANPGPSRAAFRNLSIFM